MLANLFLGFRTLAIVQAVDYLADLSASPLPDVRAPAFVRVVDHLAAPLDSLPVYRHLVFDADSGPA